MAVAAMVPVDSHQLEQAGSSLTSRPYGHRGYRVGRVVDNQASSVTVGRRSSHSPPALDSTVNVEPRKDARAMLVW